MPQKWFPSWIRGREPRMQLLSVIRSKSTSNPYSACLTANQPLTTHNLCPTRLPRLPGAVHCLISKSKRPPAACHAPKSPSPHSFNPFTPSPTHTLLQSQGPTTLHPDIPKVTVHVSSAAAARSLNPLLALMKRRGQGEKLQPMKICIPVA